MPETEDNILAILKKAYQEDLHFSEGKILSSMYTRPHRLAVKAHRMFLEANLGNPEIYPGTKKLERKVIKKLLKILHGKNLYGCIVSGGTEANITALWLAKKLTRNRKVIIPKSAHLSFFKACDLLSLEPLLIELDKNYRMDISRVEEVLSNPKDICAVVGIAGTTELGVIDPIEELSKICFDNNVFLHIDAAFGGFVIPFLKELYPNRRIPEFDFRLPGVCSIVVDPHKMGLATIPSGALLLRRLKYLKLISRSAPYLTGSQVGIIGTRCSASIPATYAVMQFLWKDGYRKIVKKCIDATEYLVKRVEELGLKLVMKPVMNIVGIKLTSPRAVIKKLDQKGWKLSLSANPPALRIVVMPHVTKRIIDKFIMDLENAI